MSIVDGKASSPLKRQRSESDSSSASPQPVYQSTPGGRYDKDQRLVCDQCGLTFRKHSDLKKHNARHSRSYRCVEEGCPRSQIGFATINDLYRHEKSVHGKHVGKSRMYRCFASGCAKASKLWPRLDNFKQHLIRMHPSEDVEALVKKSEQWHAEEEGDSFSQPDGHSQDSVINSLQNVGSLRSPPHPLGAPSRIDGGPAVSRRWDLTPPTTANNQERRGDLRQILTEPSRPIQNQSQTNGERRLEPSPAMQPPLAPHPPPSTAPPVSSPPQHQHPNPPPRPSLSNNTTPAPEHHAPPGSEPPRLQPSTDAQISRPAEVRELSTEARCRSCVWNNRRCYVDQTNPRHCVSCRGREECIFRRTVIRDAPADFFTWPELVGVEHIPGGHLTGAIGQGAHLSQGQGSSQGMRMEGVVQNQGPGGRREGDS